DGPIMTALIPTLAASVLALSLSTDPLFQRMEGRWTGRGERVQLGSGHRIAIDARVESRQEGTHLVSRNTIRQLAPTGASRAYTRVYWLEAIGEGRYALGADGAAVPAAGRFEGDTFTVLQDFGGEAPLRVESVTRFREGLTEYRERLQRGDQVVSE